MFTKFHADNFKSRMDAAFHPHEVHRFLGQNNAGKTNLCQATPFIPDMRLAAEAS